jgi:hypothetical protein
MKNSIGFIGVGQAGGNICHLFEAQGFHVMYINTSQEDLRTLNGAKWKHHIAGGEGTAKDRKLAKTLLMDSFQDVTGEVFERMAGIEFIFVVFSAGGGTGSGISPMLIDVLSQELPDKNIGAITILPAASELIKTQSNAYECFGELSSLESLRATFVMDNNGRRDKLATNDVFVSLFNSMLDIPSNVNRRGSIDAAEIKRLLRTPGCMYISRLPKANSSTAKLCESFSNGIFAPIEPDGSVSYIALSAASEIDTEILFKRVGRPIELFQGYNQSETICVLSGISYSADRLAGIKKQIIEEKNDMQAKQSFKARRLSLDNNFDLLNDIEPPKKKATEAVATRQDIFRKYIKKD